MTRASDGEHNPSNLYTGGRHCDGRWKHRHTMRAEPMTFVFLFDNMVKFILFLTLRNIYFLSKHKEHYKISHGFILQ